MRVYKKAAGGRLSYFCAVTRQLSVFSTHNFGIWQLGFGRSLNRMVDCVSAFNAKNLVVAVGGRGTLLFASQDVSTPNWPLRYIPLLTITTCRWRPPDAESTAIRRYCRFTQLGDCAKPDSSTE
jgi:hypothetical protein